jgi:hypothetical protein
LVLLALAATAASAQQRVVVDSKEACPKCTIQLTRVATLGKPTDEVLLGTTNSALVRDTQGRYYVANTHTPGVVAVYDARGTFLRTIGRYGSGPGEFVRPGALAVLPGDSLIIFDGEGSIFGPDGRYVRTFELPGRGAEVHSVVVLSARHLMLSATVRTADRLGLPLHLADAGGTTLRSYGSLDRKFWPDRPWSNRRVIAAAGGGRVWAAPYSRYELEQWDTTGNLLRTVVRSADWFRPWEMLAPPGQRPHPQIMSLSQDARGYLWTVSAVASPDWVPDPRKRRHADEVLPPLPPEVAKKRRSGRRIEVIDPATGRLLRSQYFTDSFVDFLAPDLIYSIEESEDGIILLAIWRIALKQP